ncbi:MAG: class I SAM-dependent methyltransferase [Bacteroidota bacterium]
MSSFDRDTPECPLCGSASQLFYEQKESKRNLERNYYQCISCQMVHVPPTWFLSPEEEKARYDEHNNDPDDPNYREFLSRLFDPLRKQLQEGGGPERFSEGLDFGSGPGPTLSLMFEEKGYDISLYDPYYAPYPKHLERTWDFITTTETVEHLHEPLMEMDRLWSCLKPGGWLGVMTSTVPVDFDFASWHYKNDPTHVVFWTEEAFEWLANRWGAELRTFPNGVFLFRKGMV